MILNTNHSHINLHFKYHATLSQVAVMQRTSANEVIVLDAR